MTPYDFAARHAHRAEMRRYQPVEPMVVEDPAIVRGIKLASYLAAAFAILILLPVGVYAYETRPVTPVAHSPGAASSAIHQPDQTASRGAAGQQGDR